MTLDPTQLQHTPTPGNPLVQDLLHAIGQPLTSLQMCVLLRDRPSLDRPIATSLLHDMADQVTLLSRLFDTLRRVLDSEIERARITADDLALLLPGILPQWRQSALERDITVLVTGVPPSRPRAPRQAPHTSIEACLQDILAAALESTPDRGSITIALSIPSSTAPSRLHITGGHLLSELSFPGRFALPAAKTLLDSAEQTLTYSFHPFQATLALHAPASSATNSAVIDQPPSAVNRDRASGLPG